MTPSRSQSPADFRHRLLTPVNHILGYADLLIEDAEADGRIDVLDALRSIHAEGLRIFDTIQASITAEGTIMPGFSAQLAEMCGRIAGECDRLAPTAGQSGEDLLKIRGAADELIGLSADDESLSHKLQRRAFGEP
jgi:signal transduction histidine kinase